MRLQFLPADASGRVDAVLHDRLFSHMDNFVNENPDCYCVGISHFEDYRFNETLHQLHGKKWCLFDTLEIYSNAWPSNKSHLFGISETPALYGNPEWQKFSRFVRENPPIIQFVRELYSEDQSRFLAPLEWPCVHEPWAAESRQGFYARPFDVCFTYGISDCSRPRLHGKMLQKSCEDGFECIQNLDHVDAKINQSGRKFITVHTPHTHRRPLDEIMLRQAQSRISVGCKGAGMKTFRHCELLHTVPAIHGNRLAWAHPWIHGQNCIFMDDGFDDYEAIHQALQRDDLWEIYLAARDNLIQYQTHNYIRNHILPSIEKAL